MSSLKQKSNKTSSATTHGAEPRGVGAERQVVFLGKVSASADAKHNSPSHPRGKPSGDSKSIFNKETKPKIAKTKSIQGPLEAKVYSQKGISVGTISLRPEAFGLRWNSDLVHQVSVSMASTNRRGTAHAKDRSEVSGGGKKPWKQKGTGRARHGSIRSPLWVGGGVAHGPRKEKNYDRKVNKKVKAKALLTILSRKFKDGEIIFIDSLNFSEPKTKDAKTTIDSWKKIEGMERILGKKTNAMVITLPSREGNTFMSFKNIGNIAIDEIRNINPLTLLQYKSLAIINPDISLPFIYSKAGIEAELIKDTEKKKTTTNTKRKK